jgi:hypothetical protein
VEFKFFVAANESRSESQESVNVYANDSGEVKIFNVFGGTKSKRNLSENKAQKTWIVGGKV